MTLTRSQRRQTMETLISADPEVGVIKKKAPKKQSQALLTPKAPLSSTVPLVTSSLESLSPPVETMTQRLECIHIQSSNEDNNMYCSPCNPFDDVSLPPLNKPRHEVVEMIRGSCKYQPYYTIMSYQNLRKSTRTESWRFCQFSPALRTLSLLTHLVTLFLLFDRFSGQTVGGRSDSPQRRSYYCYYYCYYYC